MLLLSTESSYNYTHKSNISHSCVYFLFEVVSLKEIQVMRQIHQLLYISNMQKQGNPNKYVEAVIRGSEAPRILELFFFLC